jgi:hypothetical protein
MFPAKLMIFFKYRVRTRGKLKMSNEKLKIYE